MAAKQQVKRFRDPLCPKPILDRAAFDKALKANGITLSDNHFDSFYQRLHRSGYPPLDEFVAELRGEVAAEGVSNDDGSVVSVSSTTNFRTKNSISSRPGRKSQLPKALLDFLSNNVAAEAGSDEKFATVTSKVQLHQTSADGTTTKLAVELQDGHVVESVLMRHEGNGEHARRTLCVSSQVGCAMGCTFCATGTMGIRGNLSSGEILEQLVHASKILAEESRDNIIIMAEEGGTDSKKRQKKQKRMDLIRNIVFMGMGEPLNNYHNVLAACKAMIDRRLWNLAHNRVTVSTVGVTSRMRDLTRDLPEVNLALSLHAPNQQMREKIVPAAKGTPIESLIEALDSHMMALTKRKLLENPQEDDSATDFNVEERQTASKKKRAMIEYVMLTGDTSTIEAAHQLGKLCEGRHLVVNLIPYNKTDVKDLLSCPSQEHMQEFRRIVSSYGSFCSIRRTMGADIAGACGQLVVEEEKKKQVLDIEDGPFAKDIKESRIVAPRRKKTSDTNSNSSSTQQPTDPRLRQLTIATAITASLFVVSASLLVLQRRKR
jgi:adenine C2-methylase RlmN of 23S rRNA A2503 and tRNA A37